MPFDEKADSWRYFLNKPFPEDCILMQGLRVNGKARFPYIITTWCTLFLLPHDHTFVPNIREAPGTPLPIESYGIVTGGQPNVRFTDSQLSLLRKGLSEAAFEAIFHSTRWVCIDYSILNPPQHLNIFY